MKLELNKKLHFPERQANHIENGYELHLMEK